MAEEPPFSCNIIDQGRDTLTVEIAFPDAVNFDANSGLDLKIGNRHKVDLDLTINFVEIDGKKVTALILSKEYATKVKLTGLVAFQGFWYSLKCTFHENKDKDFQSKFIFTKEEKVMDLPALREQFGVMGTGEAGKEPRNNRGTDK